MQRVVLVPSAGLFLAETKEDPSNCKLFSLDLVPGGKPDKNTGGSEKTIGVSRGGAWGPASPLFFEQNEARSAENKKFFGDRPPPPVSEGLDPPL